MSDYTPTTGQVRDEYRFSNKRPDICGKDFGAEFDRWLERVEAEAQVEALRKFRRELIAHQFEFYGVILLHIDEVVDQLAESADRIAREAGIETGEKQ